MGLISDLLNSRDDASVEDALVMMKMKDKPKETALTPLISGAVIPAPEKGDRLENDFAEVRTQYKELLAKGADALDELIHIAGETNSPRAYEVVFQGLKNIGELGEKIMTNHKVKKEIEEGTDGASDHGPINIENAAFFGSLANLQKNLGTAGNARGLEDGSGVGEIIDAETEEGSVQE